MQLQNYPFLFKFIFFLERYINNVFYGNFKGINSSEICSSEIIIYDEEKFAMGEMKDVFGNSYPHFLTLYYTIHRFVN